MKITNDSLQIPDPNNHLIVIKRYLHILSLLQNENDSQNWNANSIANILSYDETDDVVISDKVVRDYICNKLEQELGIDIDRTQGGRKYSIAEDIDRDTLLKLLQTYSSFVVCDSQREQLLKLMIIKNPQKALWVLARIYFAIKQKKRIQFDYTNVRNEEKQYDLNPYFMTFRANGLYLVGKRRDNQCVCSFVLNRIEDLSIFDHEPSFDDEILTPERVYKNSVGAYFNENEVNEITLRYKDSVRNRIEDIIIGLDPDISEADGWVVSTFCTSDLGTVCSQILLLGDAAEIVSPLKAREYMKDLLSKSSSCYT